MSQEERGEVLAMLNMYSTLFDGTGLGPMAGPEHEIQTRNSRPVHQDSYQSGRHECQVIGEKIEHMLQRR